MKFFTRNDDKKAFIIHSLNGQQTITFKDLIKDLEERKNKFTKNEIVGFCDKLSLELILDYLAAIEADAIPCFVAHPSYKVSKEIFDYRVKNLKNLGITNILSKEFNIVNNNKNIIDNIYNILFIQTSSGTTNNQKAFCISKNKLLNQINSYSQEIDFNENSVSVSWLPVYHDMGLITSIFMPLVVGATSIIIPTFDWVSKINLLFECIDLYQGTHCWMPNFAYSMMGKRNYSLNNKECKFFNCSEVCRKDSIKEFYKKYSNNLFCTYAMAENVFAVTTSSKIEIDNCSDILSSGRPINGSNLKIEDNKIFISGNCLFDAFLKDNQIKPFENEWYFTGDNGEVINNELFISSRTKDVTKIFGKQINLLDVDATVNEHNLCHPGRCVSFEQDSKIHILYENNNDCNLQIMSLISNIFDVSCVAECVVSGKLIKTSSGKFSRELNKKLFNDRNYVRNYFNSILKENNLPTNIKLRESGIFDSFSLIEAWSKINIQLKKHIDWNIDFKTLETVEDFVNAI